MIRVVITIFYVLVLLKSQDALLTPQSPFSISLNEQATYSQNYLLEIDMSQYRQDWNTFYSYQSANGHSTVELEFVVVHKSHPQKQGHVLSRCRLDQSKRWCRIESQAINFNIYLVKLRLDCVSNCKSNITVGFASRQWNGNQAPKVLGAPLENEYQGSDAEKQKAFIIFKIIGWMVLTLIIVLIAIRFGEKIATIFDRKMEEERQSGLREKRIPLNAVGSHKKSQ